MRSFLENAPLLGAQRKLLAGVITVVELGKGYTTCGKSKEGRTNKCITSSMLL
jgi:hypothetical protein